MPFGIGPLELIIVLVIVLVIFGPKRLPGLGRSLGSGMREFKDSLSGKGDDAGRESPQVDEPGRVEPAAEAAPAKEQVSGERRG
jgi:sec-independent protein translocase protein TatA